MHVVLVAALLCSCASLPERAATPEVLALAPATSGLLADRVQPAAARRPGQSGFRLVDTGTEAYALRAYSAQAATRSLDIQTYIWHADLTGRLLARQALMAADRGVRVRILVDDLDARAKNDGFAALDAHPMIEVRLYNPLATRSGKLRKAGEFATGFSRLNHRMHNKSWIADNRIALVGGRNLGDEYFDAHDGTNFVDLDFLMVGPVVEQASASFDRFWNSESNFPIAQLAPRLVNEQSLARVRLALEAATAELASSGYAEILREDPRVQELLAGETALHWTPSWTFVSDDPMKTTFEQDQRSAVLQVMRLAIDGAERELTLISPYFVPGERGTASLVAVRAEGIEVRILTNSLAANDVALVHGGYMRYRPTLLENDVKLWELKPTGTEAQAFSLVGSSGSSLHTKAMIVDDAVVFVGSYNLDPRSTSLNTEQGVLAVHPALARELMALFDQKVQGERAWSVSLEDDKLAWSDGTRTVHEEPEAGFSKRFQAWLMKILPLESQL
jgi:putative cardiolipin synthase